MLAISQRTRADCWPVKYAKDGGEQRYNSAYPFRVPSGELLNGLGDENYNENGGAQLICVIEIQEAVGRLRGGLKWWHRDNSNLFGG